MKVEHVRNDTYRVRKTVKGRLYTVYFDHKPSQKEVLTALSEKLQNPDTGQNKGSFEVFAEKFLKSKKNVLSESTYTGYKKLNKYVSDNFKSKKLYEIAQIDIQNEVNRFSVGHSPKYVRNFHSFISDVLKEFRPSMTIKTTLPQKKKFKRDLPIMDEIKLILDATEGTPYHIAFQLAVLGMRRSEICAATIDDLNGNILTINKACIYDDNTAIIRDNTKNVDSTREILLPDALVSEIEQAGEIFRYKPQTLTRALHKYQDALGIKRFRLHDMRAFFVSYCHAIGIPDEYIMKSGGWRTDFCMKSTYRDILQDKTIEMQKKITGSLFG